MRFLKLTFLFLFVFSFAKVQGQDIHFTHFTFSPLTVNPAETGAFEGTFRIGGIYRDQWRSIIPAYQTPSLYIDAPIIKGFGKKDWIGIGASVFTDQAGSAKIGYQSYLLSVAYHLSLDRKGQTYLSIGGQGGFVQRGIDLVGNEDVDFGDELLDSSLGIFGEDRSSDPTNPNSDNWNSSFTDYNAGLMLSSVLSKTSSLKLGIAFRHILTPEYNLIENKTADLPFRINFYGKYTTDLNKKWLLEPRVLFETMSAANQLNLQMLTGIHLNKVKDTTLKFGLGYRLADAAQALFEFNYKQFRAGMAFDIGLSSLNDVAGTPAGFEIALAYIGKIYKTPVVKPVILCPRF